MRKIDSSIIVCTPEQSQQLIGLGIIPASVFCFERNDTTEGDVVSIGEWEFAGEYMGQDGCLPAWTLEEICVLIGGDYGKPDLYGSQDWSQKANMMQWISYLPKSRKDFACGAQAAAHLLEYLLRTKEISAAEANARMDAYISKEFFNPINDRLEREAEEKRK